MTPRTDTGKEGMMKTVAEILAKDAAWLENRRKTLGGSDANILMSGDDARILRLWQEKRGEVEGEDLSRALPVQMGTWTEPLNLYWLEMVTGREVMSRGATCLHKIYPFMACTLDGMTTTAAGIAAVVEAKHVNAFAKIAEVTQKYMPQLHHNMAVCRVKHAILSVFIGTFTHEIVEIECDDWYLATLIDREKVFWACVESGESPVEMPAVEAPVAPEKMRSVDMQGNNFWADGAADWIENGSAAKKFDKAAKALKELVEKDVGHATGHGVQVKRAKGGSLRISELKETANV